jgi:Skp family chaperone for outer membrane proteins
MPSAGTRTELAYALLRDAPEVAHTNMEVAERLRDVVMSVREIVEKQLEAQVAKQEDVNAILNSLEMALFAEEVDVSEVVVNMMKKKVMEKLK